MSRGALFDRRSRAFAGLLLAAGLLGACSGEAPSETTSGGAAGAGGETAGAGSGAAGTGGETSSSESAGGTGSSTTQTGEFALALVGPPFDMAFQRRVVEVEVAFSLPEDGAKLRLQSGGATVDELVFDAAIENGTARLRLPLLRGATPFTVTATLPSGMALSVEGQLHGGSRVAASIDTMFALTGGAIVEWGGGEPAPAQKAAPPDIVSVTEGAGALFALDASGKVFIATAAQPSFAAIPGLDNITAVAPGGGGHALFLRTDGRVFAAGNNEHGQLGAGDTDSHAGVVEVLALDSAVAVVAANDSSFAVDDMGLVHAWGSNDDGQLGLGDQDAAPHPEPLVVPNLADIIDVAAGRGHVLALTADGGAYAWGLGTSGQIGDGSAGILASKPQPVPLVLPARALVLAARGNSSYAVLASGALLGWGQNSLAQLGVGDTNQRTEPTPCLVGEVRAIGAGLSGGVAVDAAGALQVWGSNASGQLALPLPPDGPQRSSTPVAVPWP